MENFNQSKKPTIALCISGEPRNTMASFPYIYESFLNNSLFNIDVFIHTRTPYRTINLYNPKELYLDDEEELDVYNRIKSTLNITSEKAQLMYNVLNSFSINSNTFKNCLLMHDGIQKCFDMALNKNYDIYIRCRPDIILRNKISIFHIIHDILVLNKYDVFIPNIYPGNPNMTDDKLAIGNFKAMNSYRNILTNINQLIDETEDLTSEKWLQNQLSNDSIRVGKFFSEVDLIRKVKISLNSFSSVFKSEE